MGRIGRMGRMGLGKEQLVRPGHHQAAGGLLQLWAEGRFADSGLQWRYGPDGEMAPPIGATERSRGCKTAMPI